MSSFEFILISIAIVVGFGISEVLSGWGRQLRHRQEIRPYPLQVIASAYVLTLSLRFLWILWTLKGVAWDYPGYLLVFAPTLILALTAHLMRVDVEGLRRTPEEQYFGSQRPFFGLLAAFPIFAALNTWYQADHYQAAYGGVGLPVVSMLPFVFATFVWMGISRNPRHHWIGWTLIWAANLMISFTILPSLGAR